ncbi:sensor histidine kinase [Demequina mangrovi]|uniref:histidine kinase n=1 Tax=Demequina mangrovi TaxID=1043493 RepID=A0A1H7AMY7_9MICO|nr:HAMP domain-containing sensor histidine kinase [Demequina mangrovi]SEJ66316.1 Signal transduction histidine kinase [Demequina mangrovi]
MSTLRARLLASHLAVAAVGVIALIAVGATVGGVAVQRRMGADHESMMRGVRVQEAVADVLPLALGWGAVAGIVAAALAALWISRRVAGPLAEVQEATRAIAAGDYSRRVPRPPEAELAGVADDVNALAARLSDAEERRARLIDEVAHEMRTPLTVIGGTAEGLIDGVVEPGPESYERIAAEASRLRRLAEDLSTLSRAEESALSLSLGPADLGDLVRAAADRLRTQFDHRGVGITVEAPAPVPVTADADRVIQVLVNLLGNALAHSAEGSTVTMRASTRGDEAVVEVVDTGSGIAPEELARVFDRFYRGSGAEGRTGRGIGLTIARSLARAHGGDVTAASDGPGTGATFTLALPVGAGA